MTLKMEQLKQKMKTEYANKADEYFSHCEDLKKDGKFDINGIEMLLGEGINAAKGVLIETTEELMKQQEDTASSAANSKKHVFAEKH